MNQYDIVGSYSSITGQKKERSRDDQDPFVMPTLGARKNQGDGLQFVDVLKQFAGGLVQGFTTIDVVDEEADHWLESLAQGAGTFMGFIGMIPTGGTSKVVGGSINIGIRGVKAGMKLLGNKAAQEGAEKIVMQGMKGIRHVTQPVVGKYFTQTRSVPMYAADTIMSMGKKMLAGTPAEALATKMIGKNVILGDIAEGAIRMGLASGVSSWQGGIDQMMYSFATGAAFGGADRGVSNMLGALGKDKMVVRAMAGMLVNGVPSTIMDQPLEIQIFDYLTGAWFGTEMPYAQRKAYEAFTGPSGVMSDGKKRLDAYLNPESMPEYVNAEQLYGNQAEKVRLELKHQSRMWLGTAMGDAKVGYPSQMVAHAIFRERYDAAFEKYKNEGKTDDNAQELALDEIRKDPSTKHLIEAEDELKDRITNQEFGDPNAVNYADAMDFTQNRIKEKAVERSNSDKAIDATVGTRQPEDISGVQRQLEDITSRDDNDIIEAATQVETEGISLDRIVSLEKDQARQVEETITDNDWIPFVNEMGVSERVVDQIATKNALGEPLSARESQINDQYRDRIVERSFQIEQSGDLYNPLNDINKPIDLSYKDVEPSYKADDTFVPARDDLGLQADIVAREPIQEARDSVDGARIDDPLLDINSHRVAREDARLDVDPVIENFRTAADYVGRQLTQSDGLVNRDNWSAHHNTMMENFRAATNDYLTSNTQGFKTDYDLARWFVDTNKGNTTLKDADQVSLANNLVQHLHKLRSNKILNQYVVDPVTKSVKRVDTNTNSGRLIGISKAPAFHSREFSKLGKNTYSIKYATRPFTDKGAEPGAYLTTDLIRDTKDPDDLLWMHHQMSKDNKIFMGHVKSNSEFIYYDAFDVDPARLVDVDGTDITLDKYIENTLKEAGGDATLKTYQNGKKNYVDKVLKQMPGESRQDIEASYDKYVYNQIETFTKVINKDVPLKDMAKKGFINDALALNKRMQLINADGYTARERSFEDVAGVKNEAGDYGFNYMILSSANRVEIDGKIPSKREGYDDDSFSILLDDGSVKQVRSETSTDGAVIVRQDVFDAMVKDAGYDPESGVAKTVAVGDNQSGLGMLASKHAMVRAGNAQDSWMKSNNLHAIFRDTTAKQFGNRKIYDSQLKADGQMALYDRSTGKPVNISDPDVVYRMPVDTIQYNLTTKEDIKHSLGRQVLPKQLLQNLNPSIISPDVIQGVYDDTYRASMEGDIEVNRQLEQSKLDGPLSKEDASKIDIDKVSLSNLNDIIAGGYGLDAYDAALRQILNKRIVEDPEDSVISAEFMGEDMSGSDRVLLSLSESGQKLTPFLLAHKNLGGYVESKIVSYYAQRATRPEVDYSMKSIGLPTDEFNRGMVKAGEFMLGNGARNMRVKSRALNKDTTLGKLWDEYQATQTKNIDGSYNQRIKDLEQDLRMAVIRVPADSISGTRSLMFKGFYDNRGTGIALHSEDMASLGGMDLDIDSTFIYQDLGKNKYGESQKSLHDVLLENKDQWIREANGERVVIESKNDVGKDFMEVKDIDKTDKNLGSMFDPAYLTRAGVNATQGKQAVGYAASAKKYIESWFSASKKETVYPKEHLKNFEREGLYGKVNKKQQALEAILRANKIDINDPNYKIELVSVKKEDSLTGDNGLLAMARQAMNYSADSADVYSIMSPLKISKKLWDIVYDTKIKVTDKDGNVRMLDSVATYKNADGKKVTADLGNIRPPQFEAHKRGLQRSEAYKLTESGVRKTKSLHEYLYVMEGRVADGATDTASMIAKDLENLVIKDPNLFDMMGMSGLEHSYGPMIDAYKKMFTVEGIQKQAGKEGLKPSDKNRQQILESLFLYKSRNSAKQVNQIRKDIASKYNEMSNTKDPESIDNLKREVILLTNKAKQLVSQDISDIASSAMLYSKAEKLLKGKSVEDKQKIVAAMADIARQADSFKKTYSKISKQAASNQGVNKAPSLDTLQTQIKDFRDALPAKGQKDLFDMYLLGSLNFQDPTKIAREEELYRYINSDNARNDPNYQDKLAEYEAASAELYRNNANAFGSFAKAIDIRNVTNYYEGYQTTAEYLSNSNLTRNGQIPKNKMRNLVSEINKSSLDRPDSTVTKVEDVVVGKKEAVENTPVTTQVKAKLADPIQRRDDYDSVEKSMKETEGEGFSLEEFLGLPREDEQGRISIDPDNIAQSQVLAEVVASKTGKNKAETTREFIAKTLGKDQDTIQALDDKAYLQHLADVFDPKQTYTKEELLLIKDFKDLMGYHDANHAPGWFSSHFLSYWHGSMQKNFGSTIDPKNATLYDVRNFLQTHRYGRDYVWDVMKKGQTSKFHWKNFFWFPDTIAKHSETFDYKMQQVVAYQRDFEGNLTKVYGIAPTSTMTGLHQIASSVNDMTSAMHNFRDEVVIDDFRIMENLGDDSSTLFDYAVIAHELKNKVGDRETYLNEYNKSRAKYDAIKDKEYLVTIKENGELVNKKLTADEVVTHIQGRLGTHLKSFYDTYVKGNMPDDTIVRLDGGEGRSMDFIDINKTMERVWALTKQRQDADTSIIGMNTLGKIMYQRRLENIADALIINGDKRSKIDIMDALNIKAEKKGLGYKDIGEITEGYFPHLNHPEKVIEEYTLKSLEAEANALNITDQVERAKYIARSEQTISRSHQNYIDKMLWDGEIGNMKTEADFDAFVSNIGLDTRNKNTRSRGEKMTVPGWQRDIRTMKQYEKDIVKAYYNNMLAVLGDVRISDFNNTVKNIDPADKAKWSKFMELYLRDNLGYPSVFSEADIKALPEIKKSMYWKFTDEYVAGKVGGFVSKFGKRPPNSGMSKQEQIFNTTQWIQNFSNLEAKYQLMTLLSRPKTFINNIVGGEPNTLINTGFRHWKGSFSLTHLRNRIDPNFNSMGDVRRWAESHGATESYLANDVSKINKMAPYEVKQAVNRMVEVVKGNPDVSDMKLMEIWRKSGLSDATFDKFAFFMRASERQLRTRSFISHYLKAREVFEASGSMIDANDPLLINMAIRGVNATQFVYNNANRPAFSRTALGKVVSRFQLWAWNSTRFRAQIYSDMKQYGMQPGSDAGKRFERMMILDMMMIAMASLLPFSLFESTMPQPYGWLINTSQWLFGDEKDREEAFMGDLPTAVAPLQMVLPPSSRLITPIIGSLFSGDWERLGSYYSWTYMPYGLLARDFTRSLERPMMAPSFMLGLPLLEMDRIATKMSKTEEVGWGPLFRKVPVEE